jgi:hypothetical protein
MKVQTSRLAVAVAIPLLAALLGGCGGTDSTPQAGSPSATAGQSLESYRLAFSQCMRDHGVDMSDPGADGSIAVTAGENSDVLMAASEACQRTLGKAPGADGGAAQTDEERYAELLKHAQCFREHGVDVPDPEPGKAGALPMDAPDDVRKACLGKAVASTGTSVAK